MSSIFISEIEAMQKVSKDQIQTLLKESCSDTGEISKIEFLGFEFDTRAKNNYYALWYVWEGEKKYIVHGEFYNENLIRISY